MVDPLTSITVRLAEWSDDFEKWQDKVPYDHPAGFKDYIFREYSAGRVKIVNILKDEKRIGFLAFQIHCLEKREFYVLAVHVDDSAVDYTAYTESLVSELAKRYNCVSVAFGTIRAGLIQKQLKNGYRIAEVVMRRNIPNV